MSHRETTFKPSTVALLLFAAGAVVFALVCLWIEEGNPDEPRQAGTNATESEHRRSVEFTETKASATSALATERKEYPNNLEDLTKKEVDQLTEKFENLSGFEMTARVRSGEKVVGDVYIGDFGDIVYTSFTPRLRKRSDGQTVLDIEIESFARTAQGEKIELGDGQGNKRVELAPRGAVTTSIQAAEGYYQISLSEFVMVPGAAGREPEIQFKASANYDETALGWLELLALSLDQTE